MERKKKISAPSFIKTVRETVVHYDMLRGGEKVLAAVSGGSDSVCMLKALLDLSSSLGIEIAVANMDHGIRGDESERDSAFVKGLAAQLGLEFLHKRTEIKASAGDKRSVEEIARDKRYAFLREAALKSGCSVIATGHTLDDQAETVMMRIVSGAQAASLGGIPPVRVDGDIRIIRPLIRVEKREAVCYLGGAGWNFVEDGTNRELDHLRNRVRIEMLPFLEKYNPKLKRTLANLADGVRDEFASASSQREKDAAFLLSGNSRSAIAVSDMILQPKTIRKEIFKQLLAKAGGNIKKLTHRHWMDMDRLLRAGSTGSSMDLPGDIRVTKKSDDMIFSKRSPKITRP